MKRNNRILLFVLWPMIPINRQWQNIQTTGHSNPLIKNMERIYHINSNYNNHKILPLQEACKILWRKKKWLTLNSKNKKRLDN